MNTLDHFWQQSFWWLVGLHLAYLIIALIAVASARFKAAFFKWPVFVQKLLPAFYVGLFLALPFAPQSRLTVIPPAIAITMGAIAVTAALILWLQSFRVIGFIPSLRAPKGLVSAGPYAVVRNPIYLGNMLGPLGLALALRAEGALLYWPIIVAGFLVLIPFEERGLQAEYGEAYTNYLKRVPYRLIPYVF